MIQDISYDVFKLLKDAPAAPSKAQPKASAKPAGVALSQGKGVWLR